MDSHNWFRARTLQLCGVVLTGAFFVVGAQTSWAESAKPAAMGHAGHGHSHDHGHGMHAGHEGQVSSAKDAAVYAALPEAPGVTVSQCWVRFLPPPVPAGGFFVVHNGGEQPLTLVAAASPAFDEVMLHQTTHSEGMSRMAMVDQVTVAAGETLEFKPGSFHAMLEKPLAEVRVGELVDMVFKFENNHKATARCEVMPAGALGPSGVKPN